MLSESALRNQHIRQGTLNFIYVATAKSKMCLRRYASIIIISYFTMTKIKENRVKKNHLIISTFRISTSC